MLSRNSKLTEAQYRYSYLCAAPDRPIGLPSNRLGKPDYMLRSDRTPYHRTGCSCSTSLRLFASTIQCCPVRRCLASISMPCLPAGIHLASNPRASNHAAMISQTSSSQTGTLTLDISIIPPQITFPSQNTSSFHAKSISTLHSTFWRTVVSGKHVQWFRKGSPHVSPQGSQAHLRSHGTRSR